MTKRRKRRVWSDDEKRMICGQTRVPGVSVSQVARRYDVNANLVFAWLRDPRFADVEAADVARFLPGETLGTGALRNLAVRNARGSLLLFTDSDCIVDPGWMDRAAAAGVGRVSPMLA